MSLSSVTCCCYITITLVTNASAQVFNTLIIYLPSVKVNRRKQKVGGKVISDHLVSAPTL
jgi:hypothetical protein